ncbi:uncharacterized protein At2g29880-like [Tasmannia lanceolata]|uniref:uncharacterized protein At2g29880-like n=1 Tax=Tasmannia lanceolata TaxID=3420 RepID=UPI004063C79F
MPSQRKKEKVGSSNQLMDAQAPTNNDRSRTIWTQPMTHYFIELMIDEVGKGNNNSQGFSKQAWTHMTRLFNSKFGVQFSKDHLKNRHKTLKRLYNDVKLLLDQSGFGWDEQREMITADDVVWNNYIEAHPDATKYRFRPILKFNDLKVIFGNTIAAGRFNSSGHDVLLLGDCALEGEAAGASGGQESPVKCIDHRVPFNDVPDETSQSGGAMDISPQQSKRRSAEPSTSQRSGKLPRSTGDRMMDAINEMAVALKSLADKNKRNSENLIDALRAVPDIDDDLILDACDLLVDERKANMFLDMDVVLRRKWLMRKLRS